jgi:hypothetical protein
MMRLMEVKQSLRPPDNNHGEKTIEGRRPGVVSAAKEFETRRTGSGEQGGEHCLQHQGGAAGGADIEAEIAAKAGFSPCRPDVIDGNRDFQFLK